MGMLHDMTTIGRLIEHAGRAYRSSGFAESGHVYFLLPARPPLTGIVRIDAITIEASGFSIRSGTDQIEVEADSQVIALYWWEPKEDAAPVPTEGVEAMP